MFEVIVGFLGEMLAYLAAPLQAFWRVADFGFFVRMFFLTAAVFGIGIVAQRWVGHLMISRRGQMAQGHVVHVFTPPDGTATPRIRFRDARGRDHEFNSPLPCTEVTEKPGAAVTVIYDPLHPDRARESGRRTAHLAHQAVALAIIGCSAGLALASF